MLRSRVLLSGLCVPLLAATAVGFQEWKSGIKWEEPKVVTPGETAADPPSDAIILFGGTDLSAWEGADKWKIEHGVATVNGGTIKTKQSFGDCQVHLEFRSPAEVKGSGQGRGNSGLHLMEQYEVQILDSYDNTTYYDGQASSIYKQSPPLVNASRPPGTWQTYDILFEAPKFDEHGALVRPAYVTVLHNGVATQVHQEILGGTAWHKPPSYDSKAEKAPMTLQWHNNPVSFRNIWVRELELDRGEQYPDA
ncbi:3-keto-disaccharide hydrolase [Alienimonas californiensis]|uniref:3-keto-alpha-glucoside-1,2-lyase/3-keto-2-hydroxy-glucal hydratase domain-containing protein n=1 Tax=Alienimonas californiensis TaxID=2527989 RepID=A0A517PBX3_9PLAN|nr:DUF1080 domain-containing protein [Alienimonas californiensis]QDT16885.1 hypothetical protein CA12_29930 [Alienimonas californiensis]